MDRSQVGIRDRNITVHVITHQSSIPSALRGLTNVLWMRCASTRRTPQLGANTWDLLLGLCKEQRVLEFNQWWVNDKLLQHGLSTLT